MIHTPSIILTENPCILIQGKRGQGKTTFINNICNSNNYKSLPHQIIVSPTDIFDSYYIQNFPQASIYHQFTDDIIKNIINQQLVVGQPTLLILDDCFSSASNSQQFPYLRELLNIHKINNITIIFAFQYIIKLSIFLKQHYNYICFFQEDNANTIHRIYNTYFKHIPYPNFSNNFKNCTEEQFSPLICDQSTNEYSNNIAPKQQHIQPFYSFITNIFA
jgi:hypothetical protein